MRSVWDGGMAAFGVSGRRAAWGRVRQLRSSLLLACACLAAVFAFEAAGQGGAADGYPALAADIAPGLANAGFECSEGYVPALNSAGETVYVPSSWELARAEGAPFAHSARIHFEQRADPNGGCDTDFAHVEKIEGRDSFFVEAKDLETPPEPGKPFDAVIYQQVAVAPGVDYSLSGWLLSSWRQRQSFRLPGGRLHDEGAGVGPDRRDRPAPDAIVWAENRDNFETPEQKRVGWSNVRLAAQAQGESVTACIAPDSPFRWHGNHAFVDAEFGAPVAWFEPPPPQTSSGRQLDLVWQARQSPDAAAVEGGTFELLVDIEVRPEGGEWRELVTGLQDESVYSFLAPYRDRIRIPHPGAEQPEDSDGAWPNQRYPGVWSEPVRVQFVQDAPEPMPLPGDEQLFIPQIFCTYNVESSPVLCRMGRQRASRETVQERAPKGAARLGAERWRLVQCSALRAAPRRRCALTD